MDQPGMGAALSEGFRSVRTRVMKEAEKTGAKRILVTSAAAGEGKTTVAANLALSMAKKGKMWCSWTWICAILPWPPA